MCFQQSHFTSPYYNLKQSYNWKSVMIWCPSLQTMTEDVKLSTTQKFTIEMEVVFLQALP